MRIAQLAPLFLRVPPTAYGGTERVVAELADELVRRGHEVTLFAAGGSRTTGRLKAVCPRPIWDMDLSDSFSYRMLQVAELAATADSYDVIHSHVDYLTWPLAMFLPTPVVTTLHGRLDLPELRPLFARCRGVPLVSISHAQRAPVNDLDLNWVRTVHHGLDLRSIYGLGAGDGDYLVFLGRISPEKDPVTAIRVAIKAGIPIKMAARVDPSDRDYFERAVKPMFEHPLVEWLGEQDDRAKNMLLGGARALLLPLTWDEPFGLVFIEALACGTPVITRDRGSASEIIGHGRHGFLVDSEEEMVEACHQAGGLNRLDCRRWALDQFSVSRMADDYERVYRRVGDRRGDHDAAVAELFLPDAIESGLRPARRGRAAGRVVPADVPGLPSTTSRLGLRDPLKPPFGPTG